MKRKIGLILILLLTFSSCIFRPNYVRPPVDVPDEWRISTEESCCTVNIRWWEQLGDPVLDSLIVEALEYNNDLKVAIASVDQFYEQFRVVYSQLFPQIYGDGSALRLRLSKEINPLIPKNLLFQSTFYALLTLSYEIDIWGRLSSASDSALALYLAQVQTRRGVVLTLVTSVANAYITLRQYDAQLYVARATLKSFRDSLILAEDRFIGGTTSQLPVEQARSEMDAAAIQVKQLEIQVQQQENLLSVLLGRNPDNIERGNLLVDLTMPPCVPAGIPSDILEQRPDVMEAELRLISAHSDVGAAKANLFPIISLTGFCGSESLGLRNLFKKSSLAWQEGGTITAPIFNGGSYIAELNVARAEEREALYSYYQAILNAFKEVDDALIAHSKSLELLVVQKDQVDALAKYLYLARLEYENGQVDYLNVLDAERNLFSAQLDLIQARSYTYMTLIDIYKALGGGWVTDADTIAKESED
jgi:outer membrane protein, multidrug efflux system